MIEWQRGIMSRTQLPHRPIKYDDPIGPKAGTQQTVRMKPVQPLGIADVGLASGHVLGIARIDKEHSEAAGFEKFKN
jgi:hypothetical protein